jgi:hypothetical protein
MLKIIFYSFCVFILIICIFFVLIKYCNEKILENNSSNFIAGLVCLFNPPSDLFEHKGRVELCSGKASTKFKAKYYGPYVVEFVPKNTLGKNTHFDALQCRAKFIITMFFDNKMVFEKKVDGSQLSGWSSASESGFTLCRFDIPENIPAMQEVLLEIEVDAGDDALAQAGWIFVARTSSL